MKSQIHIQDQEVARTLAILRLALHDYHPRDFKIRLWNGSELPAETSSPRFTLVLKRPDALRSMLRNTTTDLFIAEAYIWGKLDVEGDLEAAMPMAQHLMSRQWDASTVARIGWQLVRIPRGLHRSNGRQPARLHGECHSIERDWQAVTYHYNVSNDFYALWLDQRMVYSCAYFETADQDLDTAQERKLDYLCRKLRLVAGERLLDIGCGWGGLVIHAAQRYGVHALGITLSQNQAMLANERIARAGLQNHCRVEVRDYRDLSEISGFDKIVSVGMFEHVGERRLPLYFRHAWQLLRPGGVFLNHGIALRGTERRPAGPTFIGRYVFPDSELVPVNVALRYAEQASFEVRDVESLREHYALTLRRWARRLELYQDQALQVVDKPTFRVWQLFLHGSAYFFDSGLLNLYQALLLKPDKGRSGLPLTRNDWYR
jgi:cyclopropane-fatty-acyl-phospholipid synthase